jgi:hypothetical protein
MPQLGEIHRYISVVVSDRELQWRSHAYGIRYTASMSLYPKQEFGRARPRYLAAISVTYWEPNVSHDGYMTRSCIYSLYTWQIQLFTNWQALLRCRTCLTVPETDEEPWANI